MDTVIRLMSEESEKHIEISVSNLIALEPLENELLLRVSAPTLKETS